MSANETGDPAQQPRYEGEAILLNGRVDALERERSEAKEQDKRYKRAQLRLNVWLVVSNIFLVLCTAATGGISLWQATIAKTAASAARDAARAASDNASTSAYALLQNEWTSDFTLQQMQAQTVAQEGATKSAQASVSAAQQALRLDQRAWLGVVTASTPPEIKDGTMAKFDFEIVNSGKTPALHALQIAVWKLLHKEEVLDCAHEVNAHKSIIEGNIQPSGKRIMSVAASLNAAQTSSLLSKSAYFYVFGKYTYDDVFRQTHQTTFCLQLNTGDPPGFTSCDPSCPGYNDAN